MLKVGKLLLNLRTMLLIRLNLGRVLVDLVRATSIEVEQDVDEEDKVYFLYQYVPIYIPKYIPINVPIDVDEEDDCHLYKSDAVHDITQLYIFTGWFVRIQR